jgi:circadian clock protein KaiC
VSFVNGALANSERALLFAFEESRDQLFRNARGWGVDFGAMEAAGRLKVIAAYPESGSLEDHLAIVKDTIDEFKPTRVALDSLSALQSLSTDQGFREFMIGLTAFLKEAEVTGLVTSTTESLLGGASVSDLAVSTLTDMIILLRYVEMYGEVRRAITVLKMRGSIHDKAIREFTVDSSGMRIGLPLRRAIGILEGTRSQVMGSEAERIDARLQDDA